MCEYYIDNWSKVPKPAEACRFCKMVQLLLGHASVSIICGDNNMLG